MDFNKKKQEILNKEDKSNKGSIDNKIQKLCLTINQSPDFVTSSSCAGRILLVKSFEKKNKQPNIWIWVTHDLATKEEVNTALKNYKGKESLIFKQESAILHIYCRTLEHAESLIEIARNSGFKRAGIITTKKHIVVEIICLEQLALPIFDKKVLVTESYLDYIVAQANKKLQKSWSAIERLQENFVQKASRKSNSQSNQDVSREKETIR